MMNCMWNKQTNIFLYYFQCDSLSFVIGFNEKEEEEEEKVRFRFRVKISLIKRRKKYF